MSKKELVKEVMNGMGHVTCYCVGLLWSKVCVKKIEPYILKKLEKRH